MYNKTANTGMLVLGLGSNDPYYLEGKMVLLGNGNVGIGTANPVERFQIGETFTFHDGGTKVIGRNFRYDISCSTDKRIVAEPVVAVGMDARGDFSVSTAPTGTVGSKINLITGLVVKNDGKVGIGTSTPSAKFEVKAIGNSSATTALIIKDINGNSLFTIKDDGHIGMGTVADPNFQLAVCGDIRTKRIVVETFTCDFVFDRSYPLLSLQERKKNVLKNKHLLNVASANEMDNEGNDIGNTMMGILQNVEEHELYLYQQDEKNNKQDEEMNALMKTIAKQQQIIDQLIKQISELKNQ